MPEASVSEEYTPSQYAKASFSAFRNSAFVFSFSRLVPALGFFSFLACEHHRIVVIGDVPELLAEGAHLLLRPGAHAVIFFRHLLGGLHDVIAIAHIHVAQPGGQRIGIRGGRRAVLGGSGNRQNRSE